MEMVGKKSRSRAHQVHNMLQRAITQHAQHMSLQEDSWRLHLEEVLVVHRLLLGGCMQHLPHCCKGIVPAVQQLAHLPRLELEPASEGCCRCRLAI